ncbi:MAG: SDR family oxidoreductase, partial [Ectothiorhodospiraceae bacterium]
MTSRLKDRVMMVIGAGSIGPGWGNGKASAVLAAREGARVFAVDINGDAAEETAGIIRGEGNEATAYQCDATDSEAVREMVDACRAAYGTVDVLHHNVGIVPLGGPVELAEED